MKYICLGGNLHGQVIETDGRPEFYFPEKIKEVETLFYDVSPPLPIPPKPYEVYIKQKFTMLAPGHIGWTRVYKVVECYVLIGFNPSDGAVEFAWHDSKTLNE